MKVLLVLSVLALAVGSSNAELSQRSLHSVKDLTAFNYHMRYGIPKALLIKKTEEEAAKAGLASQRIVGGSIVDISEVPYQVGLDIKLYLIFRSVCSGVLISNNRVVTAAHCHYDGVNTAESYKIILGSNTLSTYSDGLRVDATNATVHPQWNPLVVANDIAVLRINNITVSNAIQPIGLPTGIDLLDNFVGRIGLASGFGITNDNDFLDPTSKNQTLNAVNLQIISNNECREAYGFLVRNSNICTSGEGGKGTCHGDSGGPLVVQLDGRRVLVGVTSFGAEPGCAFGYPAVFSRITYFQSWVLSI